MPPPTPASTAQRKSAPVGLPATNSAMMPVQTADELWPTTATCQADVRRESTPPTKSDSP